MNKHSAVLNAWSRLSKLPAGKWMFSKLISWKAPYFKSINAQFVELRPGYCEIKMRKRRKVQNHIATVHAIAMCNMAELAGGTVTDASIPPSLRWIPKGMNVSYLAKAETDLRAIAKLGDLESLAAVAEQGRSEELIVEVGVFDSNDTEVLHASITMWLSPKQHKNPGGA